MIHITLAPADELERQIRAAHLLPFLREYRFLPGRRFRADFCWPLPGTQLIVEIDGGTFARTGATRCPRCGETPKGRHSGGTGRARDCEKQNLAVIQGWRYLTVTTQQVRDGQALRWITAALAREG